MYPPEVIERFNNPKNAGELKNSNGRGKAGDIDCSDVIEIEVLFENNTLTDAKFKVFGCPGAVSTTDAFIDLAKGKTVEEILTISEAEISNLLGGLPLAHMHCSRLPIEAFKDALNKYRSEKQE